MFVVIFEVAPRPERWDEYLETAALLRPELQRIDGFIDNERFHSRRTEGRLLSLSSWRDEKALVRWRAHATHHMRGQRRGRLEIFADYRLRVGEVTTDTHPPAGLQLRRQRLDATEIGHAKTITISETLGNGPASELELPTAPGLVDSERYDSITTKGRRLLLASWTNHDAPTEDLRGGAVRHRAVRVIRDYGMRDRRETPQYMPDPPAAVSR